MSVTAVGSAWRDELRALIEENTNCFHEPHRREIAALRPLMDQIEGDAACANLVSQMRRQGKALELHTFT